MLDDPTLIVAYAIHDKDQIRSRQDIKVMGDQHSRLFRQWAAQNTVVQKMLAHMCIHG